MKVMAHGTAALLPANGISVGRWEQYGIDVPLPFGGMWCLVPPGGRSTLDEHPEAELMIVSTGRGRIAAGGDSQDLCPGLAVLLGSGEQHVLHNTSPDEELVVLSLYWIPPSPADPGPVR